MPEPRRHRGWAHLAVGAVVLLALFDQRLVIVAETGGRGAIPASTFVLPLLAAVLVLRFGPAPLAGIVSGRGLPWAPYLLLTAVLPIVGVAIGAFPERAAFGAIEVIVAITTMTIGGATVVAMAGDEPPWSGWLVVASLALFGYALAQWLYLTGVVTGSPWSIVRGWDLETQSRLGEIVLGRSASFYANPNVLGFGAAMLVVLGFHLHGAARTLVAMAGIGALLLSESRGAMLALASAGLFIGVRRAVSGATISRAAVAALVVMIFVVLAELGGLTDLHVFDRLIIGLAALTGGGADPSVTGRADQWASAVRLLETHPLGTFGPPEMVLGGAIDNGWIRVLVQGGALYTGALLLMLVRGIVLGARGDADASRLGAVSLLIAIAAASQVPLGYPPILIYWLLVGVAIAPRKDPVSTATRTRSAATVSGLSAPVR